MNKAKSRQHSKHKNEHNTARTRYKINGAQETNKEKRQDRHLKRLEYFAKRTLLKVA